ncbi:putative beta-calactosidase [Xylariaceae sp. FL0804]|nr:putative beta-calactosidase [Xylariaceae sp. FL0804]
MAHHIVIASLATAAAGIHLIPRNNLTGPFTYDNQSFYLNGQQYQIIGGQMDPQRVPRPYWGDRLAKARAMGLNTVFSYIFWNDLETQPGVWDFEGQNNIAEWFRLAQEANLTAVLRPGPYVCGEHEWGGLPAWLMQVPDMEIRVHNGSFLDKSDAYFDRLGQELRPLQVTQGGPILMAQVENEYGSYGDDHEYMQALADSLRKNFDIPLYTTDSGEASNLANAQTIGVLSEIDGQSVSGFEARASITDPSSLGPLLNGEYYTTWFDGWGYNSSRVAGTYFQSLYAGDDIEFVLKANNSISFYVFHGATNWDYGNAGLWQGDGYLDPVTTSYDYGAPLDETGRVTSLYSTLQGYITDYSLYANASSIPDNIPMMATPEFKLNPLGSLFSNLGNSTAQATDPVTMEALNQSRGFVFYEHKVKSAISGNLIIGNDGAPRDRVLAYVNGVRVGVQSNTYLYWDTLPVALSPGDRVQLLIENLGRVDFGHHMDDQRKGIVGSVSVDNATVLEDWTSYSLPLRDVPSSLSVSGALRARHGNGTGTDAPMFYRGTFTTPAVTDASDMARDTFLEIKGGTKGVVWVNGLNMGRYWIIGPQQSLYVPGCYVNEGDNEVVVLELEPRSGVTQLAAQGRATRVWGNNYDPDAPFTQ